MQAHAGHVSLSLSHSLSSPARMGPPPEEESRPQGRASPKVSWNEGLATVFIVPCLSSLLPQQVTPRRRSTGWACSTGSVSVSVFFLFLSKGMGAEAPGHLCPPVFPGWCWERVAPRHGLCVALPPLTPIDPPVMPPPYVSPLTRTFCCETLGWAQLALPPGCQPPPFKANLQPHEANEPPVRNLPKPPKHLHFRLPALVWGDTEVYQAVLLCVDRPPVHPLTTACPCPSIQPRVFSPTAVILGL